MTQEFIIQQLKYKEAQLLNELNKVRLAQKAFIEDMTSFESSSFQTYFHEDIIPKSYSKNLTYGSKILFILSNENRPLLVDEIVTTIYNLEPELNIEKLHKTISYNLSMLTKYAKIKKHPFNRRVKYSVNGM